MLRLKSAFYKSKYTIDINEANIGKIVVSHELSQGKKCFKYFIGYNDDDKIKPCFQKWVDMLIVWWN